MGATLFSMRADRLVSLMLLLQDERRHTAEELSLQAMDLSKRRANEIRKHLMEREKVDGNRLKVVGRGWDEPLGTKRDENRRVEAQWFTLE